MQTYNENSIVELDDISHIRLRTSAYLPNTGGEGLMTLVREILDNSVDECEYLEKGQIDAIMLVNHDKTSFQFIVQDDGRGIPAEKLISVFASARVSGKFSNDHYRFSIGSFGVGATVCCSLSQFFRAITLNQTVIADAIIPYDNIPDCTINSENRTGRTGTTVIFSPDTTIFHEIQEFIQNPYRLMEYFAHHSLFGKYRIRFFYLEESVTRDFTTASTQQALRYIEEIIQTVPIFDNQNFNKEAYVTEYFGIQGKTQVYSIQGINFDNTLRIEGSMLFTFQNITATQKTKLAFVNNLLFDDNASLHTSILIKILKQRIAPFILDKNVRNFFLDHYKLPMFIVLDVKFSSAQFSGLAKTSFKDHAFRQPYHKLLNTLLTQEMIHSIYQLIGEHITVQYNRFTNSEFKPSTTMRNLLSRLNRPEKFDNCSTTDRDIAELFLVEGDSAKSDQDRNSVFQASYTLGGKPFNGLTSVDRLTESVNAIKKNKVFQDIIRILNITPGSNDLSNLNFGKVFIMADADTHGYHITNIVIGNLYALCPALIEEGRVYVTIPPLYSLNIKGSDPIYIRNVDELNTTLAYHVYYRCIDIAIQSERYDRVLTREEFVAFSEIVIKIGDELDRLSTEYMIPDVLLEQLSLMTNHLNLAEPDINVIRDWLGCEVRYVKDGHLLIVSIGSEDIVVPLHQITELIYSRILPMYREFYYGKTRLFVTTKNSDLYTKSPTTIVQLNDIFKKLSGMFQIQRYKGLGSMPPADRSKNCLNPSTRRVYQITNIGDIDTVFAMLGDDPMYRKKLIRAE